ncbi:GNAT family N-acetyltransferase [Streptomyces griseocarneus]|nr:GNAT family N-acetyltransferase [Streptomyces griseocarneus]
MTVQQSAAVVPEVRRAVPEERDAIGRLIGESFQADPVSSWVFPDEERRRVVQPRFFGAYLDAALRDGWVDVTDDLSAAALWLPVPSADDEDLGERLSAADPGNERTRIVGELTGRVHPADRAHYYLPVIVAAPGRQGQGRGRALLAPVMDRCDREGTPAYLEASSERSKALYERLGFTLLGDVIRLPEGPRMWPMWREPRS